MGDIMDNYQPTDEFSSHSENFHKFNELLIQYLRVILHPHINVINFNS